MGRLKTSVFCSMGFWLGPSLGTFSRSDESFLVSREGDAVLVFSSAGPDPDIGRAVGFVAEEGDDAANVR